MQEGSIGHLVTEALGWAQCGAGFDDIRLVRALTGGVELMVMSAMQDDPQGLRADHEGRFDGFVKVVAAYDVTVTDRGTGDEYPGHGINHLRFHLTGVLENGAFALHAAKLIGASEKPGPGACSESEPDLAAELAKRGFETGLGHG